MNNTVRVLVMKNGTPYRIQPCIQPNTTHTTDFLRSQIAGAVKSMSKQTRWLRFGSFADSLSPEMLDDLVSLDEKDRVAWCASVGEGEKEQGIGLSRYIRLADGSEVAEFALTVIDEYRRQGIGFQLLAQLIASAGDAGITTLRGYVYESNKPMLSLCRRIGARFYSEGSGLKIVDVAIPPPDTHGQGS